MWRQDFSFVFVILVTCWIQSVTGRYPILCLSICVDLHSGVLFSVWPNQIIGAANVNSYCRSPFKFS